MNIERAIWNSKGALNSIKNQKPIVLLNCPLVGDVRWDFPKLNEIMDPHFKGDVFESDSKRFLFFDDKIYYKGYNFKGSFLKFLKCFIFYSTTIILSSKN